MTGIVEFLLARIQEDEEDARLAADDYRTNAEWLSAFDEEIKVGAVEEIHMRHWSPARVLAECEAKRQVIATLQQWIADWAMVHSELQLADDEGLRAMAAVHSDHPEFDPAWKVS